MSNFIQDKVVAGKIGETVWATIVRKYSQEALADLDEHYYHHETGDSLDKRTLKHRFDKMVVEERQEAINVIATRDKKEGESDAEYDLWQTTMWNLVNKAANDVMKNYGPVIVRTVHEKLPLFAGDLENVIPKTKMEEAYKAKAKASSAVNVAKTPEEQAQHAYNTFIAICNKYGLSPDDYQQGAVA